MSLKRADPNEQTGLDMVAARQRSTVSIKALRDYLHRTSLFHSTNVTNNVFRRKARMGDPISYCRYLGKGRRLQQRQEVSQK